METVGVYEAKTRLPSLLDLVGRGEHVTITRHGKPIALLVPVAARTRPVAEIIASLHAFRKGRRLGRVSIPSLIKQGRR